ncbi:hypothetical protein CEE44_01575 [Candidatus Woesearchaeota archaeon B3_Woes]|nr:MAG: hypothetical protein CEE44_01575 [Candidatus Woesearchaeota archaeon B3_Woes]
MNVKFSRNIAQEAMFRVKPKLTKRDFEGSSPAPFVGHVGYPNLNVGLLSPVEVKEKAWIYDAPRYWADNQFKIPDIVDYRSALINSRFKTHVKNSTKFLEIAQEVGMASKPVDVEIHLKDKPVFGLYTDRIMTPTGPKAQLKQAKITSNSFVSSKVEKVVDDYDLKAEGALNYLYDKGFDENFLSKLLSIGNIGIKNNRKLVPTKWSITATDDMLSKRIINEIKYYSETDYMVFFGGYLGNYYLVLMFPDVWNFELFEMGVPLQINPWSKHKKFYATDYEDVYGRKSYAGETAGGYYASRLPILKKLKNIKRKSTVLCLRFITNEYYAPLGVWVVREATRKAMQNKPIIFSSKEEMIDYARTMVQKNFRFDLDKVLSNSVILNKLKTQRKLKYFLA